MSMRVADYVVRFLGERGVRDAFMLSGGGIMHLTDGLACSKDMNTVCLHHEQSVSMALETYARATGNFGVGYFTTGSGATNAITGLAGAWLDSVPCLFISGQVKRAEAIYRMGIPGLRQVGIQEINILPIVQSITKYAAFVDDPNDIRYHLEKAYYMAREGRPGPAWLDIPLDVQGATIDPAGLRGFTPMGKLPEAPDGQVERVVEWLKASRRPVILAGQGVRIAGASDLLRTFALEHGIPVVTSFLGIDVLESDSPVQIGRIGIKGDRAGNLAMQNADVLIVIGSSLPVAETGYDYAQFAREAKVIIVDIDRLSHLKKTVRIDELIESDAAQFLARLAERAAAAGLRFDGGWLERCQAWKSRYPVCLPEYAVPNGRINIYYFIDRLCSRLGDGDVVVTDAGSSFYAGSQAVKIRKGMRYITSGGFATMGFGLPASIGVCYGIGKKRVICITGDGSFQQNIQELQSVVHYGLPLKIFVLNNDGYLSIRFTQKRYFEGRLIGEGPTSGVSFPDLEKIAWAYGIRFIRARDNGELEAALEETLRHDGPVLCEVMAPPEQLIIPTVASEKRADGSMVSKPLEDMFPFLDRKEFLSNMVIRPVD